MCGRFVLESSAQAIADYLGCEPPAVFASRYNIAPTTPLLARTASGLNFFRWGLVPGWAKDVTMGNRMFNARAETVAEKPSFKNAFRRRRCLLPASGYYEWRSEAGKRQPYYFFLDQPLFCFAGIWERWQDGAGNELLSCALLTSEALGDMREIHDRMPVVISEQDHQVWLDHRDEDIAEAMHCIAGRQSDFHFYAVGSAVNSARNDNAGLIQPLQVD